MNEPIDRVRRILAERGLDGLLVSSPTNRRFLSGYSPEDHAPDESAGVLLVGEEIAQLFTSPNNTAWAAADATGFAVEGWQRPWERFVAERIGELGWKHIGFEDRGLVVHSFRGLEQSAPDGVEWVALGDAIDQLRSVKSSAEIDDLATAIRLTDEVFSEVAASLRPGETEREVGWRIERLSRERGGGVAFEPIVASGPHAARPHHGVTDRPLGIGEPVIIDMGVSWNGYRGDLTRTVWFGEAPERLRGLYNVVYHAQTAAIGMIAAGVRARDVDQLTRDIASEAGYGEYVLHSLGHGLGLRVHEAPSLSIHADVVLEPGHVVTVEPGLYIPEWGGVRIEDVVVVTTEGCRNLTAADKSGGLMA